MSNRLDSPKKMKKHEGKFKGKTAMIVLGGPSAREWEKCCDEIQPDVLIGANGVNQTITNLDYWLCTENMSFPHRRAEQGEERYIDIMAMYQLTGAKYRMVSRKTHHLIEDKRNLIKIRRFGVEAQNLHRFTFRQYQLGLINGSRMQRPRVVKDLRAGTVGLQCIHLAGLLGCENIHTIGYDLMFKEGDHHWYNYPPYAGGRFWGRNMFTEWKKIKTLWFWVDTVAFMKKIEPVLERDGIIWTDHSHGLLEVEGLECTKR